MIDFTDWAYQGGVCDCQLTPSGIAFMCIITFFVFVGAVRTFATLSHWLDRPPKKKR